MKEVTKAIIIEKFIEPYRDTLEEVLSSIDVNNIAELIAWQDWAEDLIEEHLHFTKEQSKALVLELKQEFRTKPLIYD